ncbi:MAG: helix-turn-helix transcriptional regulator [Ruminiclostridium sp.]|nr:helix-turn-helix transcriptional regulator [Ruminiclostridium sp.]
MLIMLRNLFKKRYNTFLTKILCFFLIIILIFFLFQVIVYNYYIKNLDEEIAVYNISDLKNVSDRFSEIITQVKNSMLLLYMEDETRYFTFSYSRNDFEATPIIRKIHSLVINNNPFVKDVFFFKKDFDFIITAFSSHKKDMFFDTVYNKPEYQLDFWEELSSGNFSFMYLPSGIFKSKEVDGNEITYLMPVVLKPIDSNGFLIVFLLDIKNVFKQMGQDTDKDLYIYNNGKLIYPDSAALNLNDIDFKNSNYTKMNNTYYFKKLSNNRDFLFLKTISIKIIQNKMNKVKSLFIFTVILSVILSFIISVIFSIKFNSPIKRIVEAINRGQPHSGFLTNISELNFINKNIQKLVSENININQDLNKKNSLLKAYFYQTRFKNIYTAIDDIKDLAFNKNSCFTLIYFIVHYKESFRQIANDQNKATFFLTEYIQKLIEVRFPDSLSFQIEDNQIVTIINFSDKSQNIYNLINNIAEKMQNENDYIFFTIAVSSVYEDASLLNTAYSEIFNISKQQRLNRNMQILTPKDLLNDHNKFYFTSEQEQAFSNHFLNGDNAGCIELVHNIFEINYNKDVPLSYFQKLGIQIINICIKVYNTLNIEIPETVSVDNLYNQINRCYTLEEFRNLFSVFISQLTAPINNCRSNFDHIKDFVIDYINEHYSEDIYLDLLSKKLNITSSYLSKYFKIKTGVNFIDYLNNVRLDKAKEMLLNTNKRVEYIAEKTGYRNPNSFIRSFKKSIGITPREFRNNSISAAKDS